MDETKYYLYYRPRVGCVYLTDGKLCSWGYLDKTLNQIMFSEEMHDLTSVIDKYQKFEGTIVELFDDEDLPNDVKNFLGYLELSLKERRTLCLESLEDELE